MFPPRPTHIAHEILADHLRAGALAIDATAGNGHDTLFLAERVGPAGRVLAFDIQDAAINVAKARIKDAGFSERVEWHCESHARLAQHAAAGSISVVMFNLGYLPGEDHQVTTRTEETLLGLAAAEQVLGKGGALSVVCYPGHEQGAMESDAVTVWMETLTQRGWKLARYQMVGTRNPAPFLLLAGRI